MLRGDRLGLRSFGSANYLRMIKRVVSIMSIWKQQISQEGGIFVGKKHEFSLGRITERWRLDSTMSIMA